MSFIDYLISKGYTPYRKIYNKQTKEFEYVPDDNINYFSSCAPGYLDIRLLKDGEEIIWGLHQVGHQPTLIYPRPSNVSDSQMSQLLIDSSYEDIYNLIKVQKQILTQEI